MPHQDQIQLNREAIATLREAVELGILTNTNVAAADTVAGLRTAVSGAIVHADQKPALARIDRAIDILVGDGSLTDALINPLTTTAGLLLLGEGDNDTTRSLLA